MAEANFVLDIGQRDGEHTGLHGGARLEAYECRHEPPGLGDLKAGRRERADGGCLIDVERAVIGRQRIADSGQGADFVEIDACRERDLHGPAELPRESGGEGALGRHEQRRLASTGGAETLEQRCAQGLDGGDEQSTLAPQDLHGTTAPELAHHSVERQGRGVAVDSVLLF